MAHDVTIAISGAGPVGMALAALLVKRGIPPSDIALLDGRAIERALDDPRSIALSWGSRQLLESIDAWPAATDSIEQIHVSRRGHFGRTLIDRSDHGVPALGYVTRYGILAKSLDAALRQLGIAVTRPAMITSLEEEAERVVLSVREQGRLAASIVVQAEGGFFGSQETRPVQRDYAQTGVVAHVSVSRPIRQRAFERFTEEGPVALLPQEGGYALVWCVRPETAATLMALDDIAFLNALQHTFGDRLGRFTAVGKRHAFPLGLSVAKPATARTVSIGNAAQTLHPVAGQGLNLGLRDAAVLANHLAREASPARLARFLDERDRDRRWTIRLTDGLARAFAAAPDGAWSQSLLGASLALTDLARPAKRLFAEQMMFGSR